MNNSTENNKTLTKSNNKALSHHSRSLSLISLHILSFSFSFVSPLSDSLLSHLSLSLTVTFFSFFLPMSPSHVLLSEYLRTNTLDGVIILTNTQTTTSDSSADLGCSNKYSSENLNYLSRLSFLSSLSLLLSFFILFSLLSHPSLSLSLPLHSSDLHKQINTKKRGHYE